MGRGGELLGAVGSQEIKPVPDMAVEWTCALDDSVVGCAKKQKKQKRSSALADVDGFCSRPICCSRRGERW